MRVTEHRSMATITASAWDQLELDGVPFLRHAFFQALERSGAIGADTGWELRFQTVDDNGRLVGGLPLFQKMHSWGEFVFDFAWANAYQRHGLNYYPKLVVATPYTPATGPRLLVHREADRVQVQHALLAAARTLEPAASSLHLQFVTAEESTYLKSQGLLTRVDCQFHWHNQNFGSFEDFLATFTAEKRKKVKRERRRVSEAGITFQMREGCMLTPEEWQRIYALHANTFHRHGHEPYLSLPFFMDISAHLAKTLYIATAHHNDLIIATAIFFRGSNTLYGRYWGADADYHSLHFETCYHQGIEYCIAENIQHFEPGTQGEHKIARGFSPTLTHSAHDIREPRFRTAIDTFLQEERRGVLGYAQAVTDHVPYKQMTDSQDLALSLP